MIEKIKNVEEFYNSGYVTANEEEPYWDEDYIGPEMSPIEEEKHIQMMEEKSNSIDECIRLQALEYPCPISVLEKLSEDISPKVRAAVVSCNTPEYILEKLLDDESTFVQKKVLEVLFENPFSDYDNLKEKILSELLTGRRTFPNDLLKVIS